MYNLVYQRWFLMGCLSGKHIVLCPTGVCCIVGVSSPGVRPLQRCRQLLASHVVHPLHQMKGWLHSAAPQLCDGPAKEQAQPQALWLTISFCTAQHFVCLKRSHAQWSHLAAQLRSVPAQLRVAAHAHHAASAHVILPAKQKMSRQNGKPGQGSSG